MKPIYITLQNGRIFKGWGFGKELSEPITCQIVFTNSMVGYVENITNPNFFGQALVQSFPSVGNYGVNPSDSISEKTSLKALIVSEHCTEPSNFRMEMTLSDFLTQQDVVGVYGVDTRALTKIICSEGSMNCLISNFDTSSKLDSVISTLSSYKISNAVKIQSTENIIEYAPENEKYRIGLFDFGTSEGIIHDLLDLDCRVIRFPADTMAATVQPYKLDGIVLSNGSGNPEDYPEVLDELEKLMSLKIPMLGIDFGHLLLAKAHGAKVEPLKYGHHGGNIPVKYSGNGKVYVTTQAHVYGVESIDQGKAETTFVNINDKTIAGLKYRNYPAASVQFFPVRAKSPQDLTFLYEGLLNGKF